MIVPFDDAALTAQHIVSERAYDHVTSDEEEIAAVALLIRRYAYHDRDRRLDTARALALRHAKLVRKLTKLVGRALRSFPIETP